MGTCSLGHRRTRQSGVAPLSSPSTRGICTSEALTEPMSAGDTQVGPFDTPDLEPGTGASLEQAAPSLRLDRCPRRSAGHQRSDWLLTHWREQPGHGSFSALCQVEGRRLEATEDSLMRQLLTAAVASDVVLSVLEVPIAVKWPHAGPDHGAKAALREGAEPLLNC